MPVRPLVPLEPTHGSRENQEDRTQRSAQQHDEHLCASIPGSVGVRQVSALAAALGWERKHCLPRMISGTRGPGNALIATIESEHVTEQITGFGERGISSEQVAARVSEEAKRYLAAGVPVGKHLADQLLLPMALGAGGSFRTLTPSLRSRTQLDLLQLFIGTKASATEERPDAWRIDVEGQSSY